MEDMELAVQAGASQIILGTIFETECKKGLQGKGVEFVRQICARCPIPVYAIGGMNPGTDLTCAAGWSSRRMYDVRIYEVIK